MGVFGVGMLSVVEMRMGVDLGWAVAEVRGSVRVFWGTVRVGV